MYIYMPILIEIPGYFMANKWVNKKTYIWNSLILDLSWYDIFEYINNRFNIPIDAIKIMNNCKLYRYDNIENYPIFQSIINNFRYIDIKQKIYTDTMLINVYIMK
jgi:hypothetical protein